MNLKTQRLVWQPGAINAATTFSLPAGYQAARYTHAEIQLYDHNHVAMYINATAAAADSTTFVPIQDGTGVTVTGTAVSNAGGAGANITVPTSTQSGVPYLEGAVVTYVSATSLQLNVALEGSAILVLDFVPLGEAPAYI